MKVFEKLESEVRGYCRNFPTVFDRAEGSELFDESGSRYLDFFAGAGALNYGHNPPAMRERLVEYIQRGGVTHSLDMATVAKRDLLERFQKVILQPRGLSYKLQFTGPTGTNAVEAALKLARKVTGRHGVVSFTNAFHGMTLGALSVTGNAFKRGGAGVPLNHGTVMPFDGYFDDGKNTLDYLEALLIDTGSGIDIPAAIVLETVQAEGGINVASTPWLRRLAEIAREHGILLIVDDIQVGCGRTGPFFSFENVGIEPDIVCLSKSLSGYGVPFALTLIKPEHDVWSPGEHNGTFRGHNLAFITANAALDYWETDELSREVARKGAIVRERLQTMIDRNRGLRAHVRGRGLIQGLSCDDAPLAGRLSREAFRRGLICETAGPDGNVLKVMPPLTIDDARLTEGLDILERSIETLVRNPARRPAAKETAVQVSPA